MTDSRKWAHRGQDLFWKDLLAFSGEMEHGRGPQTMKRLILFPMAAALAMIATATAGPALKQIDYESVLEDGQIEVRRYDSMQVVTGPMDTDESRRVEREEGVRGDSSFKMLLGYLNGDNAAGKKFPMRAPIFVDASKPEDLTMSFVLAEKSGGLSAAAPAPANGALSTRSLAGGHFTGRATRSSRRSRRFARGSRGAGSRRREEHCWRITIPRGRRSPCSATRCSCGFRPPP
jgi:hypothetical protein